MATIYPAPYTAVVDGDFVVFLIGMRVNRLWKPHKWLPVFGAMRPMIQELVRNPEKGLLGARLAWIGGPAAVQYWRSFEHLEAYAREPNDRHLPAWRRFNRAIGKSGDVGIWHETFLVRAGEYECVYRNMPVYGLAAATSHVPVATGRERAAARISAA